MEKILSPALMEVNDRIAKANVQKAVDALLKNSNQLKPKPFCTTPKIVIANQVFNNIKSKLLDKWHADSEPLYLIIDSVPDQHSALQVELYQLRGRIWELHEDTPEYKELEKQINQLVDESVILEH